MQSEKNLRVQRGCWASFCGAVLDTFVLHMILTPPAHFTSDLWAALHVAKKLDHKVFQDRIDRIAPACFITKQTIINTLCGFHFFSLQSRSMEPDTNRSVNSGNDRLPSIGVHHAVDYCSTLCVCNFYWPWTSTNFQTSTQLFVNSVLSCICLDSFLSASWQLDVIVATTARNKKFKLQPTICN